MGFLAALVLLGSLFQDQSPRPSTSSDKQMAVPPAPTAATLPKVIHIPRISRPPKLEEFESMHSQREDMARLSGFIEKDPIDGAQPTQQTDVYMGYDHQNLYVVWICFDKEPGKIRAHLSRRENIFDDDYVEITLDTFHDQRHGLVFSTNPLGIQSDGLYTEGGNGTDTSWDAVWNTSGKLTRQGYIVLQSIPFRSMRFRPGETSPAWGVTLMRNIPRADEDDWWPRVSSKISGRLVQEATILGFEGVSPGKNMQFNPYAFARTFRTVNQDVPTNPVFQSKLFDGKAGLDSKFVFKDSLVLDTTVEPDFSQVESDEPQNTGKQGPWALGFLVADDRSPGKRVLPDDPFFDKRALFAVGRVAYDLRQNSNIGLIYTHRELNGDYNRVGGLDTTLK